MKETIKSNQEEFISNEELTRVIRFVEDFPATHPHLAKDFSKRRPLWQRTIATIDQRVARGEMSPERARSLKAGLIAAEEAFGTHDTLTGLLNRREWENRFQQAEAASRRHAEPLSVLGVDLNNLRAINNKQGHDAGDKALKEVAGAIERSIRIEDFAARVGGDELQVACIRGGLQVAQLVAERIGKTLTEKVTVSIGVGELNIQKREKAEDFLKRVDQALYRAKAKSKPGQSSISISHFIDE